jgi:hypothetical protein
MGKLKCFYADKDPETMRECSAWKRNNLPARTSRNRHVMQEQPTLTPVTHERVEDSVIKSIVAEEQLTLF